VANITGARPIDSLETLAAIPYVGPAALKKLKAYVASGGFEKKPVFLRSLTEG